MKGPVQSRSIATEEMFKMAMEMTTMPFVGRSAADCAVAQAMEMTTMPFVGRAAADCVVAHAIFHLRQGHELIGRPAHCGRPKMQIERSGLVYRTEQAAPSRTVWKTAQNS